MPRPVQVMAPQLAGSSNKAMRNCQSWREPRRAETGTAPGTQDQEVGTATTDHTKLSSVTVSLDNTNFRSFDSWNWRQTVGKAIYVLRKYLTSHLKTRTPKNAAAVAKVVPVWMWDVWYWRQPRIVIGEHNTLSTIHISLDLSNIVNNSVSEQQNFTFILPVALYRGARQLSTIARSSTTN